MLNPMDADIPALFDRAGCTGQLCMDDAAINAAIGAAAAAAVNRLRA